MYNVDPHGGVPANFQVGSLDAQVLNPAIIANAFDKYGDRAYHEKAAQKLAADKQKVEDLKLTQLEAKPYDPSDASYIEGMVNDLRTKSVEYHDKNGGLADKNRQDLENRKYEIATKTQLSKQAFDQSNLRVNEMEKSGLYRQRDIDQFKQEQTNPNFAKQEDGTYKYAERHKGSPVPIYNIGKDLQTATAANNQDYKDNAKLGKFADTPNDAKAKAINFAKAPLIHKELIEQTKDLSKEQLDALNEQSKKDKFVEGGESKGVDNPLQGKGFIDKDGVIDYNGLAQYQFAANFKAAGEAQHPASVTSLGIKTQQQAAEVTHSQDTETGEHTYSIAPSAIKGAIDNKQVGTVNYKTQGGEKGRGEVVLKSWRKDSNGKIIYGIGLALNPEETKNNAEQDVIYNKDYSNWLKIKTEDPTSTLPMPERPKPIMPTKDVILTPDNVHLLGHNEMGVNVAKVSEESYGEDKFVGGANLHHTPVDNNAKLTDEQRMIKSSEMDAMDKRKQALSDQLKKPDMSKEVHPKTKEQWVNAPKGSWYIDANGKTHIK